MKRRHGGRMPALLLLAALSASCVTGRKAVFYAFQADTIDVPAQLGDIRSGDRGFHILASSWTFSPEYQVETEIAGKEGQLTVTDDSANPFSSQLEKQAIGTSRIGFGRVEYRARLLIGPFVALSELFLHVEAASGTGPGFTEGPP